MANQDSRAVCIKKAYMVCLSVACAQEVYAKIVFRGDDVRWNHRFCDVLVKKGGQFVVDFRTFHETTPVSGAHLDDIYTGLCRMRLAASMAE